MTREMVLIKTRAKTPAQAQSLASAIRDLGGEVNLQVNANILIATMDAPLIEQLRGHPLVELVGGVNFRGRVVQRRRKLLDQ